MRLAPKLLIVSSITSVVAISFIAYVIFSFTKLSVSEAIQSEKLQLARQTMDKIDRTLYERYIDVQTIAGDGVIQQFLIDVEKNPRVAGEKKEYSQDFLRRVKELSIVTGPWDNIEVVGKDGIVAYSANKQEIGKKVEEDNGHAMLFSSALLGDTVASDISTSKDEQATLFFATPIRDDSDPEKRIIGVVITHLSWPIILEVIGSITDATVALYNREGVKIASNNGSNTLFKENKKSHIPKALEGKEESINITNNANEEIVISSAIEKGFATYRGKGWMLTIEQPTKIAFTPAVQAAQQITLIVVPIILMMNGILLLFMLQILRPIQQLTQTTKDITKGDLSKRATISSHDEIGELGLAFNNMAGRLQESYQVLEQKIKDKTVELEQKVIETERINKLMTGRELKMIELKKQIEELQKKTQ